MINFLQEREEKLWNDFISVRDLWADNPQHENILYAQRTWYNHLELMKELEIPTLNDLRMAKFTGDK